MDNWLPKALEKIDEVEQRPEDQDGNTVSAESAEAARTFVRMCYIVGAKPERIVQAAGGFISVRFPNGSRVELNEDLDGIALAVPKDCKHPDEIVIFTFGEVDE